MLDHVTIRVADRAASERFYRAVLERLGFEPTSGGPDFVEWNDFSLAQADAQRPRTERLHIGFAAPSRAHVEAFWQAGTAAGHRDDGPPGPRPEYGADYFGGFLLDPDGNSAEAVHHGSVRGASAIDHLWIRVADLEAAGAFYDLVGLYAGFERRRTLADRIQFAGAEASFSVVAGEPTRGLHLAFPAASDAVVDAFHGAAVAAGHRDNGAPGKRPAYHAGYYAAFVLDPDGGNVELVNHNR